MNFPLQLLHRDVTTTYTHVSHNIVYILNLRRIQIEFQQKSHDNRHHQHHHIHTLLIRN
jgi:hypothetical protein